MRWLLAIALVTACSPKPAPESATTPTSPSSPTPGGAATATPPAAPRTDVTHVITADVTGIMRMDRDNFVIAQYVASLLKQPPACWTTLRSAITSAYQLETTTPGQTYVVIEGNLPRSEAETCIQQALAPVLPVQVERDGDLAVFRAGKAGTVYAGWRDGLIVAGRKEQVQAALAGSTPELQATWRQHLAELPAGPLAMWRSDALVANLLGAPTTSYVIAFDRMQKAPQPQFAGRVIAHFATPGDAAIAARRVKQGELAVDAPVEIKASFKRMKVQQTGATVQLTFDTDTFAAVDMPVLQQWVASLGAPH